VFLNTRTKQYIQYILVYIVHKQTRCYKLYAKQTNRKIFDGKTLHSEVCSLRYLLYV